MTNKDIKISYYSGNIRFTKCIGHVSLDRFIIAHKNPTRKVSNVIKKIVEADCNGDKKLKRKLKHQLYSFTPSALIEVGDKRKYDNLYSWTGLMQLDFDKIEDFETAIDLKETLFNNHKEIICCYLSPSRLGIKAIMKISKPRDKDHYKALHKAVENEFEMYSYFDPATKNAMLPLFLSIDKNILYRDISECETWDKENWSKPEYKRLNNKPPTNFNPNDNFGYKKTVRIFENKIKNINNNGHPQLRNACLILGSRSGAGYIDKFECIKLAESLILSNNYLSKGVRGYIDTAKWAIDEGYKTPKYYD